MTASARRRLSRAWSTLASAGTKGRRVEVPISSGRTRNCSKTWRRSGGWRLPSGTGQGWPGAGGVTAKRLETQTPLMGSAGWEAGVSHRFERAGGAEAEGAGLFRGAATRGGGGRERELAEPDGRGGAGRERGGWEAGHLGDGGVAALSGAEPREEGGAVQGQCGGGGGDGDWQAGSRPQGRGREVGSGRSEDGGKAARAGEGLGRGGGAVRGGGVSRRSQ